MLELEIVRAISNLGSGTFLDKISWFISLYSFFVVLGVVLMVLVWIYDRKNFKKVLFAVIIALALHFVITEGVFKVVIPQFTGIGIRERPYISDNNLVPIGKIVVDSSFPSGHVSTIFAVGSVFMFFYRKKWFFVLGIGFGILVALSRIHNGMHYPSDVIVGAGLGILYGLVGLYFANQLYKMKRMNVLKSNKKIKS
ncbi:MAG: phosphatase PAP2 family protein [Candidatus Pacearchaeota archaeon]|jgi:undecaprenyl-diphosphatase